MVAFRFPDNKDTHGINTVRLAQVWMDEYINLFYMNRPDLKVSGFAPLTLTPAYTWMSRINMTIYWRYLLLIPEPSGHWRCYPSPHIAREIEMQIIRLVLEECLPQQIHPDQRCASVWTVRRSFLGERKGVFAFRARLSALSAATHRVGSLSVPLFRK